MLEGAQLVEHATKCPDVTLKGIWVILADFGTHIVRCTHHCHCCSVCVLQNLRNTEVSKFDCVVASQEDILSLEISVKHFATMDVLKGETQLDEPVEYLGFCEAFILLQLSLYVK